MKETLGQRLKKIRETKKLTQVLAAKKLNISQQRYQNWEQDRNEPDTDMLIKLSYLFNVPVEWLIEGSPYKGSEPARKTFLYLAPLIAWAKAGRPIDMLREGESEGPAVPTSCKDPDCFALWVRGDDMGPEFKEGEIIIVSPNADKKSGDYVIVELTGEVALRQLRIYPDAVILRPLNDRYEETVLGGKERKSLNIIGKVVEKFKKY